jgi:hydrogenase expression/formation protein HypE
MDEPPGVTPFGACPVPQSRYEHVLLGHGSGGQLTAELIGRLFLPAFGNDVLAALEDQATLALPGVRGPRVAFTTDSFVVRPLFFPGGDIGKLAVHGTVNDLAVGGARPLYLAAAFILEEGLPLADLRRIAASMRDACREAGVALVTGDTKVVDVGRRAWPWSPATPRWWTAARATASSSPRPASACYRRGGRCRSTPPGPATGSSCPGRSATTASR